MDKSKWEYKNIKDICTSVEDGDWIESQDQSADGIRLIQTGNIGVGEYLDKCDKSKYISEDTFERLNCKEVFPGDCLISRLPDPIGRSCIIPTMSLRMITAVDCSILRFKDFVLPNYFVLYSKSRTYNGDINKYATGATRKRISRKNLEGITIPIPPISDQQRIVAELDCLNEMIALKQEQLKEFDKLAQSIFYDMFGNPVTNEKGWDKVFMKQIIKVVGGYAFKSDLFKDNGIPILRIGNINTGEFRPINMVYWIEDDKLSRYVMHPGDLVLSLTGTVGKDDYGNVCILDNSYDRYYLNQRNAKLEIIGNVEKLYLSRLLKIDEVKAKLTGTSRGVRQANISNKDIENLIIPLPPLALQQQFAEKIQAIEAQKELVKKSIAETQQLLDSRMDFYFD